MKNMTNASVKVLIHEIEEKAKAKGWALNKKAGGSVPVNKCPKCRHCSVITFIKTGVFSAQVMDVCFLHGVKGEEHCNMIFHVSVRNDKFGVPKYGKFHAEMFADYNAITAPAGINVCQVR
jgi:hypothetical protein